MKHHAHGSISGHMHGFGAKSLAGDSTATESHFEEGDGGARDKLLQQSVFYWIGDADKGAPKLHQTITAETLCRKYGVPVKHIIAYLQREISEEEACCSLPFSLIFVISYAVMAIAHDDAITIHAVEDTLKDNIVQNAKFGYTGPYTAFYNIDGVDSFAAFWSWLRIGLLPLLFQNYPRFHEGWQNVPNAAYWFPNASKAVPPNDRGFWLVYNRIIGGLKLVQERDGPDGGSPCSTVADLLPLYNSECFGGLDYDLKPGLGLPSQQAQNTIDPKKVQWVWATTDLDVMQQEMIQLEQQNWLDKQTKKVEIAIPTYNAEFGLHTLTRVNFYFSRGGHIWKKVIPLSQYADWHDRWYYGVYDGVWVLCLGYMFLVEIIEIQALVRSKGCSAIYKDYLGLWNFIDWLGIFGGLAIILMFLVSIDMRSRMNELLDKMGAVSDRSAVLYQDEAQKYILELQDNVNYVRYMRLAVALYPLIIIMRLFKSFSAQPRLALVTRTLSRAAPDLSHFAIVFICVFVTFALCGVVLFGREVENFATFSRAFASCFRTMLGDTQWEEMSVVGRTQASIWLWLFTIVVVLLFMNIIIAIIMDHFEEIKVEAGRAETIWEEARQMFFRWRGMRQGKYVPLHRVLDAVQDEVRRNRLAKSGQITATQLSQTGGGLVSGLLGRRRDMKEDHENVDEIMFFTDITKAVARLPNLKIQEDQAIDVMVAAACDYYEQNKKGADLDEVLQLTQKVNFRVKKLVKLARQAHEQRDTGPVRELEDFTKHFESYLEDVKKERAENEKKIKAQKEEKKELERRLVAQGGGFVKSENVSVNKRASINRTGQRLSERPPAMD